MLKQIKKVIAGIIVKDNKILIAQRAKKDDLCGKWEFPGGKMEPEETEQECLKRELFEELSIEAEIGEYFCSINFEYHGIPMELLAYFVPSFSNECILYEHKEIKWVEKSELLFYDVPSPNKLIIAKLLENNEKKTYRLPRKTSSKLTRS